MYLPSRICALVRPSLHTILLLVMLTACASEKTASEPLGLEDFATQYMAAWCSHNATVVASFFDPQGSLQINQDNPAIGRRAIRASVQKFVTAFPDLIVTMDAVKAGAVGST